MLWKIGDASHRLCLLLETAAVSALRTINRDLLNPGRGLVFWSTIILSFEISLAVIRGTGFASKERIRLVIVGKSNGTHREGVTRAPLHHCSRPFLPYLHLSIPPCLSSLFLPQVLNDPPHHSVYHEQLHQNPAESLDAIDFQVPIEEFHGVQTRGRISFICQRVKSELQWNQSSLITCNFFS